LQIQGRLSSVVAIIFAAFSQGFSFTIFPYVIPLTFFLIAFFVPFLKLPFAFSFHPSSDYTLRLFSFNRRFSFAIITASSIIAFVF
jgi:hypothetical protein